MGLDHRELRNGLGRFATGVTVVTCRNHEGQPHGATVNAFTAVSLDPALCQVTLTRKSKACAYLDGAPFAVNVLAEDQLATAWHFAGRPQEPQPEWVETPLAPVLVGNAATLTCRPWRTYDGGDHLIVIGEIAAIEVAEAEPLLFYAGGFRALREKDKAHWAASVDCPDAGWFDAGTDFSPLRRERTAAS
ncbi:flavin reductase family protein [Saccharopolyspora sp. WRP15-2]|uniref:Flavin reductase family protein n=1 Tax=Saccharopolyspora oryzae TaxID=2997343 RepID=A0ABT4UWD6_9PSEU|nr:flavin reductase family protein [Saccharopolyspora oryzae]MDA3626037.1 flavin reductase family protein [Saccharopolyspora oryzae]